MSEQTFVQQLVQESLPVWEQCLHSEFLERLADGTLDEACFKGYIVEDSLYLREYAKVFAWGMTKAKDMQTIRTYYSLLSFVNESEDAERLRCLKQFGLTDEGIQSLPLRPEAVRVQAALQCGADLIFALPAPCACAGAEAFARAGVRILAAAGCDALVFGAETPDAALLMEAARVLCSAAYRTELKQQLAAGARSFAAARQAAVEALCPGTALAALLDKPNNNLAVEYCKAILEQEAPMTPVPLPRVGAGHGQALDESGHAQFASASALRALWAEQGADALAPYVPEKALKLYKKAEIDGTYTDYTAVGRCELALLRAACARPEPFAAVRGVSEGLDHRLENAVRSCTGLPQLLDALTTVRYPRARMRRLAMDAALGYEVETVPALPPYLHLLGARREALPMLKNTVLPVSHSLAKLEKENADCARMAAAQAAASDFGALCRRVPGPMGGVYRQKIIFLTN